MGHVDAGGEGLPLRITKNMVNVIAHRGPDAIGVKAIGSTPGGASGALGSARLAIIDLSESANQPMSDRHDVVTVVFNGEIYNFRELREELEARGSRFMTRTDTEVLVHGYLLFGDDIINRLDGMFAIGIWDEPQQRLLLARDRLGKKPLYYTQSGRRMAFSSEIKSLRVSPWVDQNIDYSQIPAYLSLGYVPSPSTIYSRIHELPPGSICVFQDGRLKGPTAYWDPLYLWGSPSNGRRKDVGWEKAGGKVRDLLKQAVEKRLVSDVPLGVLLSGGLDSSAVVAGMRQLGVQPITYTVGVVDESTYDERPFARLVSRHFSTDHHEISVSMDAANLLPRLIWHLDQPFADSSVIPTYLIAQSASRHLKVVLTGDGGDEVFGGYERFSAALAAHRLPRWMAVPLSRAFRWLPRSESYFNLRDRVRRFARAVEQPTTMGYLDWVTIFQRESLEAVLTPEAAQGPSRESLEMALDRSRDLDLLAQLMYLNLRTYLPDDLLVKADRMTMANSLEARSPLLDLDLLAYVASLPQSMKATWFQQKRLLRHALKHHLPEPILRRRKHGFGVPTGKWFRGALGETFRELILGEGCLSADFLNLGGVRELFKEHRAGATDHGQRLWSLLVLELWLRYQERPVQAGAPSDSLVTLP